MTARAQRLAVGIATVGPCGFSPLAPGTAGSAAGLAIFWVVRSTGVAWLEGATLLLVIAVGTVAASIAEVVYQRRDPGLVVIDEVAGMLVTLVAGPVGFAGSVLGFFVFRFFDIVKPFPARQSEALPRGWGIMADDLVAGVYAQAVLRVVLWLGVDL